MYVPYETLSLRIDNLQTKPKDRICERGDAANTHTGSGFFTMYQCDVPAYDVQNASEQSKGQLACPTVYLRGVIEVKNAHVQMNIYPRNII